MSERDLKLYPCFFAIYMYMYTCYVLQRERKRKKTKANQELFFPPPPRRAVSERGVVFLRDQDVTPTEMKDLMLRITKISGCVSSSSPPYCILYFLAACQSLEVHTYS